MVIRQEEMTLETRVVRKIRRLGLAKSCMFSELEGMS